MHKFVSSSYFRRSGLKRPDMRAAAEWETFLLLTLEEWILRATGCRVPRKSGSFFLLEEAD
ncbi:hypothetical protein [Leptospira noguchii]|uniref:hypothetical protein n=1 Tax=Leptospira noguchii TaxID=28182 RepID=UPI003B3BD7C6